MPVKTKICGIRTPDAMTAALEGGVDYVGLVFHPSSPRYVEIEVAAYLANYVPAHVGVVGLFVNPDKATLAQVLDNVRIDMIQLHGTETPEECAEIAAAHRLPVMKALSVSGEDDLQKVLSYETACDWLLLDAPPPQGADAAGGNGVAFDWNILKTFRPAKPWMLAGGLTAENVREAIALARPDAVDVSSGVERERGIKDPVKITAFLQAATNPLKT